VIAANAGPILLVTGVLTLAAGGLLLAPGAGLRLVFGTRSADALTLALTRHWGLLVGLVGCLLVYASYHVEIRVPVMVVAVVEKFALGLIFGTALPRRPMLLTVIAADAVMAVLYLLILGGPR
jgi:hypothetical protein